MAVYNPNNGTPSNKPFSVQGKPEVGRQYYFDFGASNKWRMYQSTAEILSYLDTPIKRQGHPFFVVNTGGTLSNGVITGGVNELWWFKNGVADGDLVRIVSDVVIPSLQSVTDVGNKSTNALQLTGNGNYDAALNAFSFGYAAGVGILNVKSPLGNTGVAITGQGATVSVDGETVLNLSKPSASSGVAGRVSGRLKISDGTEADDAVTKAQLDTKPDKDKAGYLTTIAQIRSMTGNLPAPILYTTDLNKEGNWYYDPTDTTSVDNTGTILVTADGKRIKRIFETYVSAPWFGAIPDGITDNTGFFQKAIDFIISQNGGILFIPIGNFLVNGTVYINPTTQIPIEIRGLNNNSREPDIHSIGNGSNILRTISGDIFRVNNDSNGRAVFPADQQFMGFSINNISFKSEVSGVNCMRIFRTRTITNNLFASGCDNLIYQPQFDQSPTPIENYCDLSSYTRTSILYSSLGGLDLAIPDGCIIEGFSFESQQPTAMFGIQLKSGSSITITGLVYSLYLTNTDPILTGSAVVKINTSRAVTIQGMHIENCRMRNVVYCYFASGVTITGVRTKFYTNDLVLVEGCKGVNLRNVESVGNKQSGTVDVRTDGSYTVIQDVVLSACYFYNADGTQRNILRSGTLGTFNDIVPLERATDYNFTFGNKVLRGDNTAQFPPVAGAVSSVLQLSYDNSTDNNTQLGFSNNTIWRRAKIAGVQGNWVQMLDVDLGTSLYPKLSVVYNNPPWIGTLAWPKITSDYDRTTDANYTITNINRSYLLVPITANRTLTLPSVQYGKFIYLYNRNDSAFSWSTSATVVDNNGVSVSVLPNASVIVLFGTDDANWRIQNIYRGDNTTWKYSSYTTTIGISASSQNEVISLNSATTFNYNFLSALNTKNGTIKLFKNKGTAKVVVSFSVGVTIDGTSAVDIILFPTEELEVVCQSPNTWILIRKTVATIVDTSSSTLTKAYLNATYLNSNKGLTVYFPNLLLIAYKIDDLSSGDWMIVPGAIAT